MRTNRSVWKAGFTGVILLAAVGVAATAGCSRGGEAAFPSKPIEMVIAFAPGGAVDVMGRALEQIQNDKKIFSQPFTLVSKPGGSAAIGMAYVAGQTGNPHVIMLNTPTTVITPLQGKSKVSNKDLTMVARLVLDDYALFVLGDSPFKTTKDFVEAAKKAPNQVKVSGNATGSPAHVVVKLLERNQGIRVAYVPFDSQGEALTSLLGGHSDVLVGSASSAVGAQLKAGKLRCLGSVGEKRALVMSDIPTLKEQGIGVTFLQWRGVAAPKNLPKDALQKLEDGFKKFTETPQWKDFREKNGLTEGFMGSAEFTKFVEDQTQFYSDIMPDLGLK